MDSSLIHVLTNTRTATLLEINVVTNNPELLNEVIYLTFSLMFLAINYGALIIPFKGSISSEQFPVTISSSFEFFSADNLINFLFSEL